ncbi:MAG: carboxylating nicotinate-nucleotide diphosphorylase [Vicinamibacterales bacterium]|nr:carboxylating nicotinate-nucleotide diphosphorylase [Vicinamibacterales bacterium]
MMLDPSAYRDLVARALAEDVGQGDLTSALTVDASQQAHGIVLAKSTLVVAGLAMAAEVFTQVDPATRFEARVPDGARCEPGDTIATVTGPARALLTAERTALNLLQRLSGIATLTRRFVDTAAGQIVVLDTRKTTPGLRALEKYAVRCGGGTNHRQRLDDGVLIKDNHKRLAGGVGPATARALAAGVGVGIEVEVETLDELDAALAAGATRILVDNFTTPDIHTAVARCRGRAVVEISGGVTLERLPELAATGAAFVSVGALTHSAPAVDLSFEIEPR